MQVSLFQIGNKTCAASHYYRVGQAESDDVSELIQLTDIKKIKMHISLYIR